MSSSFFVCHLDLPECEYLVSEGTCLEIPPLMLLLLVGFVFSWGFFRVGWLVDLVLGGSLGVWLVLFVFPPQSFSSLPESFLSLSGFVQLKPGIFISCILDAKVMWLMDCSLKTKSEAPFINNCRRKSIL